ncbi:Pre-mRNA-processing factor 39 [Hypsibius exemplaris]|uniref:Pre-mRNA-processing factor 39 n=1 Tax=Hypsibius exemplaris TaxID=2072580 RepID=A0A1W0WA43_HYPEX|nr:Pre-mRNA-processing factor 39 [Hypsibius exemplaris]
MDIPLPSELLMDDLSNTSDGTGQATVASVGLYANGTYETLATSDRSSASDSRTRFSDGNATNASGNATNASGTADSTADSNIQSISLPVPSPTPSLPRDPDLAKPIELRKLWTPVKANPTDFTAWTTLLSFVEQQELISFIREAYDAFFSRYPFCWGYWKKYSELEKRFGTPEQSETVLEQGVNAIPLSVELWMYYVECAKDRHKGVAGEGRIRELFERAIAAVGLDFKSDDLWDAYIAYEKSIGQMKNVFGIYERLLRIPTLHYKKHFEGFQQLLLASPVQDLITPEELEILKPHIPEGEDVETALRQLVTESRRSLFTATESEAAKRWTFEENIKRPYFHVKPLENNQLKNWHEYLDFEIAEKQSSRIIFLFERCLVACALYEEFWRKYLDYLKSQSMTEYIRYAYQRVCSYHLTNKTGLHLDWAAFEEETGDMAGAIQALQNALKHQPNKAILSLRQIGVLRRLQTDPAQIENAFDSAVQTASEASLGEFFLIKQARYHLKVKNNKGKAMEVLRTGLKRDPASSALLYALIDCELQQLPLDVTAVLRIFDEVTVTEGLSHDQKVDFLERKILFLEDFGSDVRELRAAHHQYYELTGQAPRGRKRAFGEDEDEAMDQVPAKKPFENPPPSLLSTPPMANPYGVPMGVPPAVNAWPAPPQMMASPVGFPGYPPQAVAWPAAASYGQTWPPYQATST